MGKMGENGQKKFLKTTFLPTLILTFSMNTVLAISHTFAQEITLQRACVCVCMLHLHKTYPHACNSHYATFMYVSRR